MEIEFLYCGSCGPPRTEKSTIRKNFDRPIDTPKLIVERSWRRKADKVIEEKRNDERYCMEHQEHFQYDTLWKDNECSKVARRWEQ